MSWESLLDLQKRFERKLDFRDIHIGDNLVSLATAAMFAISENYAFNLVVLEQGKSTETRIFLDELRSLDILGDDVLLYHDTANHLEGVIKISIKQEFRRTELDFMAFSQRKPFIVVSFTKDLNSDCGHLLRLLHFSSNFRGLLLIGDQAGQDFTFYA